VVAAKTETPHARLPGTIGETAEAVRALGRRALPVKCNVREFEDVERMRDAALDAFGRIDILVNNAGAIHWAPVAEFAPGRYDLVMEVNVRAAFLCSRALLPELRKRKGHIVMMSPPVNVAKVAGKAPYMVSKMGMTMIMHAIANEEPEVHANALWPVTLIESEATRHFEMGAPEQWRKSEILADATVELCCASDLSGKALYDEDVLSLTRGMRDFSAYSVVPGTTPAPVCREMVE
jgi:citronellol/citronellal dehydrogenase